MKSVLPLIFLMLLITILFALALVDHVERIDYMEYTNKIDLKRAHKR